MESPTLAPGETLRLHASSVRGVVGRTGPTFRATTSIPLIQDIDLFITDRRVIIRAELFLGLFDADYVAWLPGAFAAAGADTLTSASAEEQRVLGPSLVLVATTARPSLWRGPELRLQLFLPNAAEALAALPPNVVN